MRLLYVSADPGVPVLGHKGASVHVREMASALAAAGATVAVASPRVEPAGDVLEAPVELIEIPSVRPHEHAGEPSLVDAMERQDAEVAQAARRWRADAVYERYSLFSRAGVRAAASLGVPHLLEVNAPLRDEALRYRTLPHADLAQSAEQEVWDATLRVFAVSNSLALLLRHDGVAAGRIEVTPNAVAPARFPRPARETGAPFTIGFAGGLKPWHGIEVLAHAFLLALERVPDLRLEVIGDGPEMSLLTDIPEHALARLGALTHAETIARMAVWDVGIAPYVVAGPFYFSPLKVVEYMAAAACPVASDVGDLRELLGDGARGVLVPAGDVEAFAAALVSLARDRDGCRAIGARARDYAISRHSWAANAERVLAALARVPDGAAV